MSLMDAPFEDASRFTALRNLTEFAKELAIGGLRLGGR